MKNFVLPNDYTIIQLLLLRHSFLIFLLPVYELSVICVLYFSHFNSVH